MPFETNQIKMEFTKYQKHVLYELQRKIYEGNLIHIVDSRVNSLYYEILNSNTNEINNIIKEFKMHSYNFNNFIQTYQRFISNYKKIPSSFNEKIKMIIEIDTKGKITNVKYIPTDVLTEVFNSIQNELIRRLKK